MQLTELSLRNKIVTITIIVLAVLGGIMSFLSMPKAEDPGFTIRSAIIVSYFPGGSPERVEELVTDKIEEAVMEMPEVKKIKSTSKNGFSMVTVEVYNEYDEMQPIWDKLRRKVQSVEFPSNVYGPFVNDEFGDVFGTIIGVEGKDFSYKELKDIADNMKDELLTIPNVAKVNIIGEQSERIFIEYNNDKLAEIGLSPYQLKNILAATNIVIPGGDVFMDGEVISLEPTGNFNTIEDIERTVISVPNSNQLFYVKDIADVKRGYVDPATAKFRVNNQPGLAIAISMKEGGNIIEMGEQIKEKLEYFKSITPLGIETSLVNFQPKLVEDKVNSFTASLIQSIVTVMIVLFIALGLRTGIIVAVMIPVIISITFLVMSFFGIMVEQVSLAALIIALGMLVDNSIVVSESIMVKMEHGKEAEKAAIESAKELVMPLLISSLTTCSAFLPIALAKSNVGEFCTSLAQVVTITLLLSWILALTLIPLLCVVLLKVEKKEETFNTPFYKIYRGLLISVLKNKYLSIGILIVAFFLGLKLMGKVPFVFMPSADKPVMTATIKFPGGTSIKKTEEVMKEMDAFIEKELKVPSKKLKTSFIQNIMSGGTIEKYEKEGILSWGTFIGESAPRFYLSFSPELSSPEYAFILINTTSDDIIPEVGRKLEAFAYSRYPDMDLSLTKLEMGPPTGKPIQIRIMGKNLDKLYDIVTDVKQKLRETEGTKNITDDWGMQAKKVVVNINQTKARKAGLTSQDVAGSLLTMIDGYTVSQYREGTDSIPIVLQSKEGHSNEFNDIQNSKIYALSKGTSTNLSQVADIEFKWQPSVIFRKDRFKTITISSELFDGYNAMSVISKELRPWLDEQEKNWGYGFSYEFGGELETTKESVESIADVLPIAGMIILLLLVAQFNSYKKVGIIFMTVPFIIIAISLCLFLSGRTFGFMPLLGLIALMGITINTAIVLMDRINIEMIKRKDLHEAIVESCQARFRPISLTTSTTICGLIPLWLTGGPLFSTMALIMIAGLFSIIIIVLLILPIIFSLVYKVNFRDYKYKVHDIENL